jgi:hypothetical protein
MCKKLDKNGAAYKKLVMGPTAPYMPWTSRD